MSGCTFVFTSERIDATYFSFAASFFAEVHVVGVGEDLGEEEFAVYEARRVNVDDIERVAGGRSFFWAGRACSESRGADNRRPASLCDGLRLSPRLAQRRSVRHRAPAAADSPRDQRWLRRVSADDNVRAAPSRAPDATASFDGVVIAYPIEIARETRP